MDIAELRRIEVERDYKREHAEQLILEVAQQHKMGIKPQSMKLLWFTDDLPESILEAAYFVRNRIKAGSFDEGFLATLAAKYQST